MKKIIFILSLLITSIGFSQTELLTNGDFSNGDTSWALTAGSVVSGEAAFATTNAAGDPWGTQLVQAGLTFNGAQEYTLTFDARADAARVITLAIQNTGVWTDQFRQDFTLTTTMATYNVTFNAASTNTNAQLGFLMGGFGVADGVYYDNISLTTVEVVPSCDDGIQNGDETGVDCGGSTCDACPEVTLPLDFSDASQLFTHDGAGAGGSVVLENGKLRFNGNGQAYDQAYLDLTETFSTIDSDNNTFTVRMEPLLVPAGEERTHLLKVSIGTGAAIEIPGKSIGSDEQDVTFNFGITGAEDWNRITIFMDFGPDGANTYNAKVTDYLISSITLGEDPPEVVPTNAATAPIAREAGDVISIFSDAYTDVALGEVDPDWSPATVETITIDGDNIWKLTGCDFFSVTQYAGIDFSEMEMMHIDFFTPDAAGLAVGVKLVDTVTSANEIISLGNTVSGAWTSVDVDLSTVSMDISNITQILYDPSSEGQTHYIDNFYFYRAATATVEDFAVNSVKMYPNPAKGFVNFSSASNEALDVAVYDMLGKEVLRANAVQSQLNISSLNPGMYFVNMTQGSNVSTKKLLVN